MRLKAFGGLAVINGEDRAEEVRIQRRQLAVLVVLAAESSAAVSRERLVGLLWADTDEMRARHALDQVLYAVRRALGSEVVVSGATSLQFDPAVLPSDVVAFDTALKRGDLEAAVAVYAGPFLDSVVLTDTPEFEQWVEGRRVHYANAFMDALRQLATGATAAQDFARAASHLRRAAASDPLSNTVTRELMLALAGSGDTSAALAAGRVHCALVRQQLEAEPDPEVVTLMEELRTGTLRLPTPPRPVVAMTDASAMAVAPARTAEVATRARRVPRGAVTAVGLMAMALLGARLVRNRDTGAAPMILRDRNQVTTSGRIQQPAISADGKYLAYVTTDCTSGCTYAIELQEVGGSVTRQILNGAKAIDYISWSPDGRNLLFAGTLPANGNAFQKLYLLSALGGTPLPLCQCGGGFFAGGDSLLLTSDVGPRSVHQMHVTGLDGVARDSFGISGPGENVNYALNVPGTSWFIVDMQHMPGSDIRVVDRSGRVRDQAEFSWIDNFQVSRDAVWLSLRQGARFDVVRVPFDPSTGRLSTLRDTVYTGAYTAFDVTADGHHLVLDEGSDDYDLWAVPFPAALRGEFDARQRLVHASRLFAITISTDGNRILIARESGLAGGFDFRLATIPFAGGIETVIPTEGKPRAWSWVDSSTIAVDEFKGGRDHLSLVDIRSGTSRAEFTPPDSTIACCPTPLPGGGWAWSPTNGQVIKVQRQGVTEARLFPKPPWFNAIYAFTLSPDGQRLLYAGRNGPGDSIRVNVLSLRDSSTMTWWTTTGVQGVDPSWLDDGSMLLAVSTSPETRTFYRLRAPGRVDSLGTIPRPVWAVDASTNLARAVISTRQYHGDAWMYSVERR